MLRSEPVFRFLRGCARLLEWALPARLYRPLYLGVREFYDERILGQPSTVAHLRRPSVTGTETADMEAANPMSPPPVPKPPVPKPPVPVGNRSLARLRGHFIPCDQSAPDLEPPRERCRVAICCAFTGRHPVLDRVIRESFQAREGESVRWMLAGSTDEDARFIEEAAARTGRVVGFVCDNKPLGRKWQTCVRHAYRRFDADLYAITGSDDILSRKLMDHVLAAQVANRSLSGAFAPDLYCANEWLVHSSAKGYRPMLVRCAYAYETAFQPLGAGRFYARKFMDRVDGYVFDSSLGRGLDNYGFDKVREAGGKVELFTVEDGPLVSVKGDWEQLNSLDAFFKVDTLDIREFSFQGFGLLRRALHPDTFGYLYGTDDREYRLFS